jgi:hypothetical protein
VSRGGGGGRLISMPELIGYLQANAKLNGQPIHSFGH